MEFVQSRIPVVFAVLQ